MGGLWGGRRIQGWAGLLGRGRLLGEGRLLGRVGLLGEGGLLGVVGPKVGDGFWEDEAGVLPLLGEGGIRDGAK